MVRRVQSISVTPSLYAQLYQAFFNGFYETTLRGRKISEYLRALGKTEYLPKEELLELQRCRLRDLLRHAAANVPFYAQRFRKIGLDPDKAHLPENFQKIPFLTKEDIRKNPEALRARNHRGRVFSRATGGSTGIPVLVFLDRRNWDWRIAAFSRIYGWAGYRNGEKTVWIWGRLPQGTWFQKTKEALWEKARRYKIQNAYELDAKSMGRLLRNINVYRPRFVIAYPGALCAFARFLKERGRSVHSPQAAVLGAEKVYPFQRQLIEEVFGCPAFETYGSREMPLVAGECERHNGMHVGEEYVCLEIVRGGRLAYPGETGEIVLTDLTNYCMPIIRYKNEDLGALSDKRCACGRGLGLLERVEGRILDTIQTPEGKMIYGGFFSRVIREQGGIGQFQVIQESLGRLVVKIVREPGFSAANLDALKSEISRAMGPTMNVEFQCVERIPLTPMGKFRVVISKVPLVFKESGEELS